MMSRSTRESRRWPRRAATRRGHADRAEPAADRERGAVEVSSDPPVPGPRALASNAEPITAVDRRGGAAPCPATARGWPGKPSSGPAAAAAPPSWSGRGPGCLCVAPWAQRATASGAGQRAGGQVGLDPVGHGDADHDTTGSRWGHGSRAWSTSPRRRGQLVLLDDQPVGTEMLAGPRFRHRHRDDAPEPDRGGGAVLVTVAAPTNPTGDRPVVTVEGATPVPWSCRPSRSPPAARRDPGVDGKSAPVALANGHRRHAAAPRPGTRGGGSEHTGPARAP